MLAWPAQLPKPTNPALCATLAGPRGRKRSLAREATVGDAVVSITGNVYWGETSHPPRFGPPAQCSPPVQSANGRV